MFKSDPRNEGRAEGEIEEAFIGDCEKDEGWGEGEEDYQEAVQVMAVWADFMDEGKTEGGEEDEPADDLVAERKTSFCLEG